jgi:spermidine synthase
MPYRLTSTPPRALRASAKTAGLTLAAISGAAVMVAELGAARALTPVFGGNIAVWATVLANTMCALAAGYAFGGWRADIVGGFVVARRASLAAALVVAAVPFVRSHILYATADLHVAIGATLAGAVLIIPAMFFMGQVSPALIRGFAITSGAVGVTAGRIYAISTLGSLVGTLAAGLWLFIYAPIPMVYLGTALAMLAPLPFLAVRASTTAENEKVKSNTSVAAAAVAVLLTHGWVMSWREPDRLVEVNADGEVCQLLHVRQSAYGEIRVIEHTRKHGTYRYMIINSADQGGIDVATGTSAYLYGRAMNRCAEMYVRDARRALVIGLGSGTISRKLERAGQDVDVVEIDRHVVEVAREHFGYRGDVIVRGGRRFVTRARDTWDVIYVDALLGGDPPWQLFTREAFGLYEQRLNPGGAVVINVLGNHLDPKQRPAMEAIVATAKEIFATVDVYADPYQAGDYPAVNNIVVATHQRRIPPIEPGDPRQAPTMREALLRSEPLKLTGDGEVLTDDSCPLEALVRPTAESLRHRVRSFIPVRLVIE